MSCAAVLDCFALGRADSRVLISLRYLLRSLRPPSRAIAILALSHVTPHPDIYRHAGNWIPPEVKSEVRPHLRWSPDDIKNLLEAAPLETFERGQLGQAVYMLLVEG